MSRLVPPEDPCDEMPTRECLGLCDLTGYCFRFPWHEVEPRKDPDDAPDLPA